MMRGILLLLAFGSATGFLGGIRAPRPSLPLTAVTCKAQFARDDPSTGLGALSFPMKPDPSLTSEEVVKGLLGGLQHNDIPEPNMGLERFYNFATFTCKSALTARQGARSLQNFTKYAAREPVFSHLVNCEAFSLGESTLIKGTPTRGDLASHIVCIQEPAGFRFSSGLERSEGVGEDVEVRYRMMLQRERLPPLEGCWMVHECLCLKHGMLFNGDSGGTTTD
mmetsp:Transcript_27976/g.70534  ORF Transcript_27976/g.70534 Transcript_27976/m.70534 type:complete len:223 (+) Transcript_27976:3-671(+)